MSDDLQEKLLQQLRQMQGGRGGGGGSDPAAVDMAAKPTPWPSSPAGCSVATPQPPAGHQDEDASVPLPP